MAQGYTVFFSYMLANESSSGYTSAIHCNYINKLQVDTLTNKEVNIYFNNINDFKFLSVSGGTGYNADKVYMLVQLIDNTPFEFLEDVKPLAENWKMFDVTNQLSGVLGQYISPVNMGTSVLKVSLETYDVSGITYTLDYLNYPDNTSLNDLCFGDEEIFLGNIETEIEATVYTTDLSIDLPINQFNSTTNKTWDGTSEVYITEVGIFNEDKELNAIGKFNNPIKKDSTISRTILFNIDF